jgi:hypothetical protein
MGMELQLRDPGDDGGEATYQSSLTRVAISAVGRWTRGRRRERRREAKKGRGWERELRTVDWAGERRAMAMQPMMLREVAIIVLSLSREVVSRTGDVWLEGFARGGVAPALARLDWPVASSCLRPPGHAITQRAGRLILGSWASAAPALVGLPVTARPKKKKASKSEWWSCQSSPRDFFTSSLVTSHTDTSALRASQRKEP